VQWDMLQDGDRLLLGLSGGKDSLSLLHILLEFQRKLPIRFDIEASFFLEVATRFFSNMMLTNEFLQSSGLHN
jgi:predicted phosphoadenosine phosphosulfate sulfurtransferase